MSLNPPIKKMSLRSVNQTGFYFTLSLMLSSNVREDPREDLADTVLIVCVHSLSESVSYFNISTEHQMVHVIPTGCTVTLFWHWLSTCSLASPKGLNNAALQSDFPCHILKIGYHPTHLSFVFFSFMVSWFIKQASADTSNSHWCIETDTTIKVKYLLVSKHLSLRCNIYWL